MTVDRAPRRALRRLDLAPLAAFGLCLFALWPLLADAGLPLGHDTLLHLHRAAEYDRSWSHGVLLPRWAESFYYGYGSPVFHYYMGLVYATVSLLGRVLGLDMLDAFRAFLMLALPAAGAGTALFVRPRLGRLAGIIAGVAYVYSPYLVYREPYVRGDYPELLAFVLFPFVMWAFDRLAREGRGRDVVGAAILLGLLTLSHNLMAVALAALLGGWIVWGRLVGATDGRRFALLVAAAALGVLLTARFWLPVLLERDAVHLDRLIAIPSLDYRNAFVPPRELFGFVPRADLGAINGLRAVSSLGAAQWTLALAGLLAAGAGALSARRRGVPVPAGVRLALYFAAAGALLIGLMLPAAEGVWDVVPGLAYLQFPWRLLGPVAFCLAVLAGLNARWIERLPGRWGGAVVAALLALPVTLTMPLWSIDAAWRAAGVDTSVAAYHHAEINVDLPSGTTVTNEFLPRDVYVIPDPTGTLLDDYANGYPVNKLHLAVLPEGVEVEPLEHGPQRDVWRVTTPEPVTVEVLTFAFAGWTARIDGVPTPITPSEPHGLITFAVPAGTHTVSLALEGTPARRAGDALSLLALAAVAVITFLRARQGGTAAEPTVEPSRGGWSWGVAGAAALIALTALLAMREGGAWVRSAPGEARLAGHPLDARLGEDIALLGYDLAGSARPGGRLDVTLYWYAAAPLDAGYHSFLHFTPGGPPVAQADKLDPGEIGTRAWTPDGFVRDEYVLHLPDGLPPGTYELRAGLWACDSLPDEPCPDGGRLPVTRDGQPAGDSVLLETLTVR